MTEEIARYSVRLGDDAMVIAQRLCEWSSRAPTLEEDLALANVGLDYLGRARMCYGYAGELTGASEDDFAYLRDVREFENALLFELPKGDFAFTMIRQYLTDEFEALFFQALEYSADETLRGMAAKTNKEVAYHLRRSREWLNRLGLGTDESHRRAQTALDELWGYVTELFDMDQLETNLVGANIAVDRAVLLEAWQDTVKERIAQASLAVPNYEWQVRGGREGAHTEHLRHLLTEMQSLQRAYPGQQW